MIAELKPGVTELYIHPAVAGEEMQHITGSWKERDTEYHLFTDDASVKQLLEQRGVKRIGWRALRDLQRKK